MRIIENLHYGFCSQTRKTPNDKRSHFSWPRCALCVALRARSHWGVALATMKLCRNQKGDKNGKFNRRQNSLQQTQSSRME